MDLQCQWNNCAALLLNTDGLITHMKVHLDSLKDNELGCQWKTCLYQDEIATDYVQLERHVSFHIHEAQMVKQGLSYANNKGLLWNNCKQELSTYAISMNSCSGFHCQWESCCEHFNCVVQFQQHVLQHASQLLQIAQSCSNRVICQWDFCRKTFTQRNLAQHLGTHIQMKSISCPKCLTGFTNASGLRVHLLAANENTDDGRSKFECSKCKSQFKSDELLRRHEQQHERQYQCPLCQHFCHSPAGMRKHIQRKHRKPVKFVTGYSQ